MDADPVPGSSLDPSGRRAERHPARALRNYLIAGLLIWIPIVVTVWVVRFLSHILDQSLVLLPPAWRPEAVFGHYIPGLGIILSFVLLFLTGLLVRNLFGRRILDGLEDLVRRIPVIGTVYGGAKLFSETVLTSKGTSFKQVLIVEFPRKGVWSIGFLTAEGLDELNAKTGQDIIAVFIPHTPNAATGFIILVAREDVIFLDMSVDEAFKMMLSFGVITPTSPKRPPDGRLAQPEIGP